MLKNAHLVETVMPLTPEIQLYLLSPDYPQGGLTDEERRAIMEVPPFWAFSWSSGQVLARWIRDRHEDFSGKRVLDFGSGSGVTAMAAALSGAREVLALDTDPVACEAIQANAELNGVAISTVGHMDGAHGDFDVILAADVLYDGNNLSLLTIFNGRAQRAIVADSRVKELPAPYVKIGSGTAVTCPDLAEPEEFRHVAIFSAARESSRRLSRGGIS